jgi:hypothetical protein
VAAGIGARTFRRSLTARLASLTALLLFGVAVAVRLAEGETGYGLALLAGLTALSMVGVIGAWGDRVTIDAEGVVSRNLLLSRLARWSWLVLPRVAENQFAGRRLAWNEVVRVQEHRRPGAPDTEPPRALFLVPARGRRLALDSLHDFDEACRLVRLHMKGIRR